MGKKNKVEKEQTFTRWTIIGDIDECIYTPAGARKWKCRCDCGAEAFVLENSLIYGSSKSCGCLRKETSGGKADQDLAGKTFGELTVIERTAQKKNGHCLWLCQCSCGNTTLVTTNRLNTGQTKSCGCLKSTRLRKDITGQTFGYLTAISSTDKRNKHGSVMWHCRCVCGKKLDVPCKSLTSLSQTSCGCMWENEKPVAEYLTFVAGTSVNALKSKKVPTNSKTGHKGVYFSNGKYFAKIVFQKKPYHLGTYENLSDAVQARQEAEKVLFDETAKFYQRWEEKAASAPAWAAVNPVEISVHKDANGKLQVSFLPVLE